MVVEFVNLSSNNREMDWRFLLNHKQNKGKLSFIIIIIIIQFFTYLQIRAVKGSATKMPKN